MYALHIMMEDDLRRRLTDAYIAEHLWLATGAIYAIGGSELKTPHYTALIDPQATMLDMRSPEQIKADIVAKLTQ